MQNYTLHWSTNRLFIKTVMGQQNKHNNHKNKIGIQLLV